MSCRRRVLIVDGSKYFNSLIWCMLIPESAFEIVGQARDANEALDMATILFPDIILADVSHSAPSGLAAIESLHAARPAIPIIAFTPLCSCEYAQAALNVGAWVCLAKSEMVDVLLQTISQLITARSPTVGPLLSYTRRA